MTHQVATPDPEETSHFLVRCEDCPFEETATGRDTATDVGDDHRRQTGHELVAVEVPPALLAE